MSYIPPNPNQMVIGADGRPRYRYGIEVRRDLHKIAEAYGRAPAEPGAEQVWRGLPQQAREFFCTQALGARGAEVASLSWADIDRRDRQSIGAKARRLLDRLL